MNREGQTEGWQHIWKKEELVKVTSIELKGVLSLCIAKVASGTEARRGKQALAALQRQKYQRIV